jgi:hypothetical protein
VTNLGLPATIAGQPRGPAPWKAGPSSPPLGFSAARGAQSTCTMASVKKRLEAEASLQTPPPIEASPWSKTMGRHRPRQIEREAAVVIGLKVAILVAAVRADERNAITETRRPFEVGLA